MVMLMKRGNLLNNLKALRKSVKQSREVVRIAAGLTVRRFDRQNAVVPVGTVTSAPRRPYRPGQYPVPSELVTPPVGNFMSTFFDVNPFSPSGRFLAVTQVPFIWRVPYPGDVAQVCVIDLLEQTSTAIYNTTGWGAQLGANVQWGRSDDELFCNDVVDGMARGVALDRRGQRPRPLDGTVFAIDPHHRYAYSGDLHLINAGIPGYGVPETILSPQRQRGGASATEGVWRTDLATGHRQLFLPLSDIVAALPEQDAFAGGDYYVFNVKVNPQNTRLMMVIFTRNAPGRSGWPPQLVTCDIDGSNIRLAVPDRLWRIGGHHPNWAPDGDHFVMNLRPKGSAMQFVRFRYDGAEMTVLAPGHKGGGHPSLNPAQTHLLTDAYVSEGLTDKAGEVPIRLIDLASNAETELARVFTRRLDGPRRIDPHPVWSPSGDRICFNGVVDGKRQVFVTQVADFIAGKAA